MKSKIIAAALTIITVSVASYFALKNPAESRTPQSIQTPGIPVSTQHAQMFQQINTAMMQQRKSESDFRAKQQQMLNQQIASATSPTQKRILAEAFVTKAKNNGYHIVLNENFEILSASPTHQRRDRLNLKVVK